MAASTVMHSVRPGVVAGCLLSVFSVLACGGDTAGHVSGPDPATTYWALHLNQHAVQLALTAPDDTIRLSATPLNVNGQPLAGLGPVRYSTKDSMVSVTTNGLVTAQFVTSSGNTKVVAAVTDTAHHVTIADTCYIQVNATPPAAKLATFILKPSRAKDTAMALGVGSAKVTAAATDSAGHTATAFAYFTSSDPNIARIDPLTGVIFSSDTGHVMLYATTWAYGVAKHDSMMFTVDLPSTAQVHVLAVAPTGSTQSVLTFWPQIVRVSAGAVVSWINPSFTDSIDVVFDDPANVDSIKLNTFSFGSGSGNIAPWVQDTLGATTFGRNVCITFGGTPPACGFLAGYVFAEERQRQFPVAGTYHYHSTIWGASGTIIVQ